MKKILICLLILGLVGIIGLSGSKNLVISKTESDIFNKKATEFIKIQEEILPQIKGSIPVSPFIYKDKYGNERTIVFGVEKDGKIIGRIVINYDKDNPIFLEFAESPPPHLINLKDIVMNKISLNKNQYIEESEYIYIFPLLFFIHFDIMEDNKKVDDLYFFWNEKRIVELENIPDFKPIIRSLLINNDIKGYYKILFDVPDYDTNNTNLCNPCGPVAGANILGYWDKHGYSKLQLDGDEASGSQLTTCLWNDMGTSCISGTTPSNFIGGIIAHTNTCFHPPYNCCYHFTASWQRPPSYNSLIIEINNNRPLGILFGYPIITPPHTKYG